MTIFFKIFDVLLLTRIKMIVNARKKYVAINSI